MNLRKLSYIYKYIFAIPKSIYVNLRLLPFQQAVKLPIIVSSKTKLFSLSGKVYLDKVKTGIIRIGFGGAEHIDYSYNRTVLKVSGNIYFKGRAKIGLGTKLIVDGELRLGERFGVTGDALIICEKKITIGNNARIAWQTIIMDTDQHPILDVNNNLINEAKEIIIGNNVWLGARCFVLKNTKIQDGCIIAANTTLTKSFTNEHSIIGGNPPIILKENIRWYN